MIQNILFVTGTLGSGGIERQISELAIYYSSNGLKVTVCCLVKAKGQFLQILESSGAEVVECYLVPSFPLLFSYRLAKLVKSISPDVVHSMVAFSIPWQVLGFKLARVKNIIFTQQNDYQNWNNRLGRLRIRLYFKLFFKHINRYTTVSSQVRTKLSELVSVDKNEFQVIPNSFDGEKFHFEKDVRNKIREELKLNSSFTLGCVARFNRQKGHKYLIEALNLLDKKGIKIETLLIGDGPLKEEIEGDLVKFDLIDKVKFLGVRSDVEDVLNACDCFVLPSLWEGFGIAIIEAMAIGLPVIATKVSGVMDIIQNGKNGILIEPGNSQQLADAIEYIISNNEETATLAGQGKEDVNERYSLSSVASSYTQLYNDF